jgi:hypothetical protein
MRPQLAHHRVYTADVRVGEGFLDFKFAHSNPTVIPGEHREAM